MTTQRLLRKLDEVHLLDSSGNIIMSNIIDASMDFVPPPEEAFIRSLDGKPVRITDPQTNRTSALIKLSNFIDTYLYIVKFMDPKLINYLTETADAISFYYSVQDRKTGIKITFAIIYVLIVSLLLFLSVTIAINFASRLTRPIINLISASEKISAGDLNTKVPKINTDKEFEKLNENFNSMIDKLKKQQDKLLLAERYSAWENVARKLAHEIKNPLTPIQLSIDRIKEKYLEKIYDDKDNFSNYLNTIAKQIKDIEHLVTEFSDFARMPKPVFKKINLSSQDFETKFWKSKSAESFYNNLPTNVEDPLTNVFKNSMQVLIKSKRSSTLDQKMSNMLEINIEQQMEKIEKKYTFLATVGSTAPFIGLFGTVWGIMNSFQSIAISRNTSLAIVAPGIAEALFATALGLLAAIPAVVAFNKFTSDSKKYSQKLENFSKRFLSII